MDCNPWKSLCVAPTLSDSSQWMEELLARNAATIYLKRFGSPTGIAAFRERVPVCVYEDLLAELARIQSGEADVLFAGRPVAYERTGGSAGGSKLIPYSQLGLLDFQRNILPWLAQTVRRHHVTGRAYFAISPAAREPESIAGVPVGLPDAAYLGTTAGQVLQQRTAVPPEVADLRDIADWRRDTLSYLVASRDLELISVWSPTFLLHLFEGIADTRELWPGLKVISCWASGPARRHIPALRRLFPQAVIEPKGLLSTEAVVTVPDTELRPVLAPFGFVEFANDAGVWLASELSVGGDYAVVVTTASGLYRYATGDLVRYQGPSRTGQPILEFIGRNALTSDLVGEKLTEAFVGSCLDEVEGFSMLVPNLPHPGYVLICERAPAPATLARVDQRLSRNPQYAYARQLGQLAPLQALAHPQPHAVVEQVMRTRGVRLGDIKPTALRAEGFWLPLFAAEAT